MSYHAKTCRVSWCKKTPDLGSEYCRSHRISLDGTGCQECGGRGWITVARGDRNVPEKCRSCGIR